MKELLKAANAAQTTSDSLAKALSNQLTSTKADLSKARRDHDEYRLKAGKVLAEKERLIESLKRRKMPKEQADGEMEGEELILSDNAELEQVM